VHNGTKTAFSNEPGILSAATTPEGAGPWKLAPCVQQLTDCERTIIVHMRDDGGGEMELTSARNVCSGWACISLSALSVI
jgi:hypothetical protein